MLEIDIDNKKGFLFVKVSGELNEKTIVKWDNDVKDLIIDNGVRNVVFDISNLNNIDINGIKSLYYSYNICRKNKGIAFLCGISNLIREKLNKSNILNYINEVKDEKTILSIITL